MENIIVIFCTSPDKTTSLKLANELVNNSLAACVNILPGITRATSIEIRPIWSGKFPSDISKIEVIDEAI